jgi:hypothetical protein
VKGSYHRAVVDLRGIGAHVLHASALAPTFAAFERDAAALVRLLGRGSGAHAPTRLVGLFSFGLSPDLLAVVRSYLECPPALTAVHVRRDVGPQVPEDLRCWHLDLEDDRMVRMIVYLTDVDLDSGPFEYIPRSLMPRCQHLGTRATGDPDTNPAYKPVSDDEMRSAVSASEWIACTGSRHTVVLADTAAVFHRTKPHQRERLTLTYTYTSRSPRFPKLVPALGLDATFKEEQRACLFVEEQR